MMKKIGIHKLYSQNPIVADRLLWDRETDPISRRGFLGNVGLISMSAVLGGAIPFAKYMPQGLIPAALAQSDTSFEIPGKEGLVILNDRPINAETPAHLLDDNITPAKHLFIRNNGIPPDISESDYESWELQIEGESCSRPQKIQLKDLKTQFKHHTYQLQIECGGNGRSEFYPPARGNQWTTGAVGCPKWTGVRLLDVLNYVGIKNDAVYVAYEGADKHLSGDPSKKPISRGVPLRKALEHESLIAWSMNGESLPLLHGAPLRMVCSGWPASVSGKWLTKILIRDRIHDGEKMGGKSYRVPCNPVAPGTDVDDANMCIIESMPVKSLITFPKSGINYSINKHMEVRGHAWAGDASVKDVYLSTNFGVTWHRTILKKPVNRLAWQHWSLSIDFPKEGYYEIWARAEDNNGQSQPVVLPGWNPRGYLNNACHRIAVNIQA